MATPEQYNMGPFKPVSLKGNAAVNGVPTFVDKLPLTIGGVAGENVKFGRVVSIDPATNRREFKMGWSSGMIVKGIAMLDPTIMRTDPGMQDYYFAGRPMTAQTMGLIDISEYDTSKSAPMEGSTVWFRNSDGMLAFNDGTDISASGYTKLDNAFVYETIDPNGGKIWIGIPLVATQTRETVSVVATPTASPATGEVASGTTVALSTTTPDASIFYTLDGTTPTASSNIYDGPIEVTAAVTIKAVALKAGMDPSAVLTAAYTIA